MKALSTLFVWTMITGTTAAKADCLTYNIANADLSTAIDECDSELQGTVLDEQYTGDQWIVKCQYGCSNSGGGSCLNYNIANSDLSSAVDQCVSQLQGTVTNEQYTGNEWIVTCKYGCSLKAIRRLFGIH